MPGLLDGVDEHPVETHVGGALQVRLPIVERPGEKGEEVVDLHGGGFSILGVWRRRTDEIAQDFRSSSRHSNRRVVEL